MGIFQPLSVAHLLAGTIYLVFAIYMVAANPADPLRRASAVLFLCMSGWSFAKMVIHNTLTPYDLAIFVQYLASPIWIMFGCIVAVFGLYLTGEQRFLKKPVFLLLVVVPAVIVVTLNFFSRLHGLEKTGYGWATVNSALAIRFSTLHVAAIVVFVSGMTFRSYLKTRNPLKRRQYEVLFVGMTASAIIIIPFRMIMGANWLANSPDLLMFVFAVSVFAAVARYGFLAMTPRQAANIIFDGAGEFMVLTDNEGMIETANKAFISAFGDRTGQKLAPVLAEESAALIGEAIAKGRQVGPLYAGVVLANGKRAHLAINVVPLVRGGLIYGAAFVMADITLKKNYEEELETTVATRTEELRRAYEHVESVNEDLARFTHAAYHDMQEPLRAVVIALDYIKTRLTPLCDSEVTDFINYAQKNSLHMRELLKDILAYMRCGRDNHAVTEFSVKELVEAVVDSMRPMTREAEAEVIVGELPDISARREEIWQLFQNLIGNALKFRKGKGVRIEIGCVKEGGSHKFAVRDDGIGIEEKYLEKIFDLFTSLYTRDRYEGSGIGLSICRKIVELHGGRIWAESQPGKGSVFYFTLPAGPKT